MLLTKKNYGRIIKWTEGIGASHLLVVNLKIGGTGRLINFKSGDGVDVELNASSVLDAL